MRLKILLLWLALLVAAPLAAAEDACTPDTPVGTVCQLAIAALHPTQPGIGLLQVEQDLAHLGKKPLAKLHKYMLKKRIPVVIGPDAGYYLVDGHHLTRELWTLGQREVPVVIEGRLENPATFWPEMQAHHWAWLADQQGRPVRPETLPRRIQDLPDYPYRSLAGFAQRAGLFDKRDEVYFVEFAWARYLGERLHWAPVTRATLAQRLREASRLACQPDAAGLPGYPGRACSQPQP